MDKSFEILGRINDIEIIAVGNSIRILHLLNKKYGKGRWRKLKGIASVRLMNKNVVKAEIHFYEAAGIGKKDFKIKRILE